MDLAGPPAYTRWVQMERTVVLLTTPAKVWSVLMDWQREADWMLDAETVTAASDLREGIASAWRSGPGCSASPPSSSRWRSPRGIRPTP